ncbi:MAG: methyltransferase family protein [Promethearchaeota archaeon]
MPHSKGAGGEHPKTHLYHIISIALFLIILILDVLIFKFSTFLQSYIPLFIRIIFFIFFLTWALIFFMLSHRAVFPEESKEIKLVKTGIYAYIRHPMYIGTPLIFIAFILLSMSLISIIPLAICIILFNIVMKFEEKGLEKIFGQEYSEYKKKVHRWIPRLTPAKFNNSNFKSKD